MVAVAAGTATTVVPPPVSAALSTTVPSALLTTAPCSSALPALSGLLMPLHLSPEALQRVEQVTPLTAVVDLVRLGLTRTTRDGDVVGLAASFTAAAVPTANLTARLLVRLRGTRRWFRWEPRR
jgi:ABC-2 type transport system permease protein